MKKLVFATLMCVAAMSARAQVLTSETVNHIYSEAVFNTTNGDYCFNADKKGNDITTLYVYQKVSGPKGNVTLIPHLKHEYDYASDGKLNNRVTYRWNDRQEDWECISRYEYTLTDEIYYTEYSRYNHRTKSFDQPTDMMVYTLYPDDSINHVASYHRNSPSAPFQLISEISVYEQPWLFAIK